MARDRLMELIQRSNSTISSNESLPTEVNTMNLPSHGQIEAILNTYAEIRVSLAQIKANLETMHRMIQTVNLRNCNETEMDNLRNKNLQLGSSLMSKFKELKSTLPPEHDYSLEARMKRTLFYGLHQSYISIWNKNEAFLSHYEQKLKKNLHMHSKIINSNCTEEEIEELIANNTTNLFVGNIIENTEHERKNLRDLLERFNELKKLERGIEDVHALFLRIQALVFEQSETIQRVEFHAQQASLYVEKAGSELSHAEKSQKKARKKKVYIFTILGVVLVIFVLVCLFF